MNVYDFAKKHNIPISANVKFEDEEPLTTQNSFTGADGSVHKLVEYRGIFLTKDEFLKCAKINNVLKTEFKPEFTEEQSVNLWQNALKSQFGFEIRIEKLELKDEIVSRGIKSPFKAVYSCRFQNQRPLLFLIILEDKLMFVDEKQFDAFNKGPYKKPSI